MFSWRMTRFRTACSTISATAPSRKVGEASFVAYTDAGRAAQAWVRDARDVDNDGLPEEYFETALVGDNTALYRNNGGMGFEERTFNSALASIALRKSGWGNGIWWTSTTTAGRICLRPAATSWTQKDISARVIHPRTQF